MPRLCATTIVKMGGFADVRKNNSARMTPWTLIPSCAADRRAGDAVKKEFGIGCVVGMSSLGGERGRVTELPHCGSVTRRRTGEWCEIELWDGRTICCPEADVWRQDDPARPWDHAGWFSL